MTDTDPGKMPESTRAEWALAVVKIGTQFIPVVGGAAAELLGAIVTPQLEKRRTAWFESIANGLYELQKQVADLTPARLSQDEAWVTAFLTASQAALRAHQQEKLDMLRNAVLNVAAGIAPDDDLRMALLSLIDVLTPCEARLLSFFHDPRPFGIEDIRALDYPYRNGSPKENALRCVTCLNGESYRYEYYLGDLNSRGLSQPQTGFNQDQEGMMRLMAPRTSAIGDQLLMFITSPIAKSEG